MRAGVANRKLAEEPPRIPIRLGSSFTEDDPRSGRAFDSFARGELAQEDNVLPIWASITKRWDVAGASPAATPQCLCGRDEMVGAKGDGELFAAEELAESGRERGRPRDRDCRA